MHYLKVNVEYRTYLFRHKFTHDIDLVGASMPSLSWLLYCRPVAGVSAGVARTRRLAPDSRVLADKLTSPLLSRVNEVSEEELGQF